MTCVPATVTTIALGVVAAVVLLFLVALATYTLWAPLKDDAP